MRKFSLDRLALPVLVALLVLSFPATLLAQQGKSHVETAFATDDKNDASEKTSFPASAGTLYVYAMLDELPSAAKVSAAWVALKTDQLEDNTKFHETFKTMGPGTFQYFFNFKPAKTWPVGTYRVDISIGGRVEKSVHFRVTK